MIITWDKTDDHVWFGCWNDNPTSVPLYLVVERLPISGGWDWAVWQSSKPTILRRGRALSASAGVAAAETAASRWRTVKPRVTDE